ncbi:hypothetical protein DACRYDRAFT_101791 [Dacryopinax primogenitus]|uniref:Peptidase S9 prolyl oligopeptidase catalytic domain-containing protein n=1 Tax=Dacryopinax primogenitus (strain DJM 731) TaxID=1858805 RepID=M5FTN1_DACPD|nr:uncharacterized protein DACRYDRAFT_101791 [Dacryopinax primogenitus]EJT98769.1 hypothetical protein DACRYDRAFT_101791 [Dacryopinax primogenitus]
MSVHHDPNSPLLSEIFEPRIPGKPFARNNRMNFYTYMVQEGNLAQLLFAKAPGVDPKEYAVAALVHKGMPPTFITHGDADQHVGLEQAHEVVNAMKKEGVDFYFEELPGLPHGYDGKEEVEMKKMYECLLKHL